MTHLDSVPSEYKQMQDKVKSDVEAYLASGGQITVIDTEPCDSIVTRVGEIYEQRF
jgi:hypothetical protein